MRRVASADSKHRRSPLAAKPFPEIIQKAPKSYNAFLKTSSATWQPFSGVPQPGLPAPVKGVKQTRPNTQYTDEDRGGTHQSLPKVVESQRDEDLVEMGETDMEMAAQSGEAMPVDIAALQSIQNDLLESVHLELVDFMSELKTNITQATVEIKRDVIAENRKEMMQVKSEFAQFRNEIEKSGSQSSRSINELTAMRDEFRSTSSSVLSEIQKSATATVSEIQKSKLQEEDLKTVFERMDALQSILDALQSNMDVNVCARIDQLSTKVDSTLVPPVLQKLDDVQAKILEDTLEAIDAIKELEAEQVRTQEADLAAVRKSMHALTNSNDLTTVLEQTKVEFTILKKMLKPADLFKCVLDRMDTVQTTVISQVSAELTGVLQSVKGEIDKLVTSTTTTTTNLESKIESSAAALDTKMTTELDPVIKMVTVLDFKLDEKQKQLEAQSDMNCSSILKAIENVRVKEEDLLPVMNKIEVLKQEIDFTPVLETINSLQSKVTNPGFLAPVMSRVDEVQSGIASLGNDVGGEFRRAIEAIHDTKVRDEDFVPVLKQIDALGMKLVDTLKLDVSFLDPLVKKISVTQTELREHTTAETQKLLESMLSIPEPVIQKISSLQSITEQSIGTVQQSIGNIQSNQVKVLPVLEKINVQCEAVRGDVSKQVLQVKENLRPVLEKLDVVVDASFFSPVISKMNAVEREMNAAQTATVAQTRKTFDEIAERLQAGLLQRMTNVDLNLDPVLQRIDSMKVDTEFCLPVLNRIDAMQVAVLGLTRKELRPTLDVLNASIEKLKTREADLSTVQRKISDLKLSVGVELKPVIERLESLKVEGFLPVLNGLAGLKSDGIVPILDRLERLNADGVVPVLRHLDALKSDGMGPVLQQLDALKTAGAPVLPALQKVDAMLSGPLTEALVRCKIQESDFAPVIQRLETKKLHDAEDFHKVLKCIHGLKSDLVNVSPTLTKIQEAQQAVAVHLQKKDQVADLKTLVNRIEILRSKVDFMPLSQRLDAMNRSLGSLSQVINKIDASTQMSILAQNGADMKPVLEALEKIKVLDADLGPVIHKIDTLVSTMN
eukprot:gnl/MRDRNA2_/MRDRNA2_56138_c0_seq1.p1 gnl/MRDRNA2_/MRDRNA2_56138_c0~~gnl/MRDRNA2_/MRDRNA2_56138_c0_seq1.p1  ORF type:complete len:1066 (-),score=256.94 gnl/MRDRNA2_/MRDRNA2_56138_c0_seq1:255-3452(-)